MLAADGRFVLGVRRHESRRVDDQLRGRSDRQGVRELSLLRVDRGSADAGLRRRSDCECAGSGEDARGRGLVSLMVTKALEKAQCHAEALACKARWQVLCYDEVQNVQRIGYQKTRDCLVSGELEPSDIEEIARRGARASVARPHARGGASGAMGYGEAGSRSRPGLRNRAAVVSLS